MRETAMILCFISFTWILQVTDGSASITWYEPPPVETTADPNVIRTINIELINASTNKQLSWNFSLTSDLNPLQSVGIFLGDTQIVNIAPVFNIAQVALGFEDRFNFTWINSQRVTLIIFKVTKDVAGDFACQVTTLGGGTTKIWKRRFRVTVVVKAEIVDFVANATTVCQNDVVSFNCSADGKPAVHTYLLYVNGVMNDSNSLGVWSRTMTTGGVFNFTCVANNTFGTDRRTVAVTVNVPPFITPISTEVITEGGDLTLSCQATGIPLPTVFWIKTSNGQRTNGTELVFRNIRRSEAGEYRCEARNPCGNASESTTIDPQFKAEIVDFVANATTVCQNDLVTFNCSAVGNPAVDTYLLYVNGVVIDSNRFGNWSRSMTTGGVLNFTCVVNNTLGTDRRTVAVTVNVPSSIMPISSEVITEGGNLTLSCHATGIPPPTVFWVKTSNGQRTNGTELVFRNITRSEAGKYICEASNPCGDASESAIIDVQYPPNITFISLNQTVDEGDVVLLNCTGDGNPEPSFNWTRLSDNSIVNRTLAISCTGEQYEVGYRCTADNGIGDAAFSDVFIAVRCPPKITSISLNQTVVEGDEVLLNCTAVGNPEPNTTLTRLSDNSIVNRTLTITGKQDGGGYRCTADNGIGNAAFSDVFITFQYPPNITSISLNQTVNESDVVLLNCIADGNPPPNIIWTRLSNNSIVSMPLTITGKQDEGGYRCTANNGVGNASFSDVFITVEYYSPINVVFSTNLSKDTVDLNDIFNLTCSAGANPAAKYRLYRVQENLVNITAGQSNGTFLTFVSDRVKQVTYRCIPFNFFGDGPTKTITVTVYYPPIITSISLNQMVDEGEVVQLICTADGNPEPNITWTRLSDNGIVRMPLTITGKQDEGGYRCTAYNGIGYAASSDVVITVKEGNCESDCTNGKECLPLETKYFCHCPNGKTGENCGKNDILADVFNARFEFTKKEFKTKYEDPDDPETREFKQNVTKAIKIEMNGTGLDQVLVGNLSNGSVIADVELTFSRSVGKGTIEDLINEALKDNKLGELDVGGFTIDGVIAVPEQSTSATPTSAGQPIQEGPPWTIIGAVAGSVVLVALVVAFVTWWVHKKRKCIKDTKIHNSECEESLHGYSPHASVNRAYAESGPPSANGSKGAAQEQSQDPGAIPTYAVVDKSKKKKKAEEKPPIYATVDKSKKRKKKTDDKNLYDSVEEPKKEKKPGEVLYAELGDFQNPAMPEVPTSPATLPPLKRPPSSEQTQYADITAFLKGDATLPQKEGNEGSEMQQQSANQSEHDVDNKETPM